MVALKTTGSSAGQLDCHFYVAHPPWTCEIDREFLGEIRSTMRLMTHALVLPNKLLIGIRWGGSESRGVAPAPRKRTVGWMRRRRHANSVSARKNRLRMEKRPPGSSTLPTPLRALNYSRELSGRKSCSPARDNVRARIEVFSRTHLLPALTSQSTQVSP
jgi:hypothetical protein